MDIATTTDATTATTPANAWFVRSAEVSLELIVRVIQANALAPLGMTGRSGATGAKTDKCK
jgi:hypothetical protein